MVASAERSNRVLLASQIGGASGFIVGTRGFATAISVNARISADSGGFPMPKRGRQDLNLRAFRPPVFGTGAIDQLCHAHTSASGRI